MNASEIILELQRIKEEPGDLQVVGYHGVLEIVVISEESEFLGVAYETDAVGIRQNPRGCQYAGECRH